MSAFSAFPCFALSCYMYTMYMYIHVHVHVYSVHVYLPTYLLVHVYVYRRVNLYMYHILPPFSPSLFSCFFPPSLLSLPILSQFFSFECYKNVCSSINFTGPWVCSYNVDVYVYSGTCLIRIPLGLAESVLINNVF